MDFRILLGRLLDTVVWRVQNGELTERRLARMIGVSQPHMHNILKGIRKLPPAVADRILATLEISVLDLVAQEQTPLQAMPPMARQVGRSRGVPDHSERVTRGRTEACPRERMAATDERLCAGGGGSRG
jgi:transcriptional regulator with XRE-family HTH domain